MIEALNGLGLSDLAIGLIAGGGVMLVALWVLAPAVDLSTMDLSRVRAERVAREVREELERAAREDPLP